jgi:predicted metal-dependent hydrolase
MKWFHDAVFYGREKIEFRYCHVGRKTLEIAVCPDRSVVVKAPQAAELEDVKKRIVKRAKWIIRQKNFFGQFEPRTPARCYVGGETHLYLGKRYRLKMKRGRHHAVKLARGCFDVQIKGAVSSRICKNLMDAWYAGKAEAQFGESLVRCLSGFKKFNPPPPRLQIKHLAKRWGSLSAKGTLTLNIHLIRAPQECIDYVVTHELCHLIHKSHDSQFYQLLGKIMPDWKKRKQKLEYALL